MKTARQVAKRIPGAPQVYRALYKYYSTLRRQYVLHRLREPRLRRLSADEVFTEIYRLRAFGKAESVSGTGSTLVQTKVIVDELPRLFERLAVRSVLDVPCGDFFWMRAVDLKGIDYFGGDIVAPVIDDNQRRYAKPGIRFARLDVLRDELPRADLVLCRDCVVHFSVADAFRALSAICRSGSAYLLTTTFPAHKSNPDIVTGQWRPLNLTLPPFGFPDPLVVITEVNTEARGIYSDKALGLWRVEDIGAVLANATDGAPVRVA
jgi:SAM-dependent methyltransferase